MDVLRFILRLPFILLRLAARSLVYLFTLLGFLLRPFTGRIRWAVPGWVTFAGESACPAGAGGQPLSENHICLIITDCCGGSGQLLHLALVSEQTEAGGCCAAGGAGYFRVCAAPFGG